MAEKRRIQTRSGNGELEESDTNSKKTTAVKQKSYSDTQLYATPAGNTLRKTPSDRTIYHSGGEIDISDTCEGEIFKTKSVIERSPVQTMEEEKSLRQIQKELFPDRETQTKETVAIIHEEKSLYENTGKKNNSPFR